MPRPRLHDVDAMLDAAEELVGTRGPAALTLRNLAHATGAPMGSLTHSFACRDVLIGQLWLRAAVGFLDLLDTRVDAALPGSAVEATVAAALTPVTLRIERPAAAAVLLGYRRDDLLGPDLPDSLAADLRALDQRLVGLLSRLATALWGRRDAAAVEVVTVCVVDLPTGLLGRYLRGPVPPALADHLQAAVEGVLSRGVPLRKEPPSAHTGQ